MIQHSYDKEYSNCFIVPTPIGNLKDMTFRAVDVLKSVDAIFAEDTRVTNNLLKNFDISNKVYQCQKFSEAKASVTALELLKNKKNIAVVTDRGTPLISDPGSLLVQNIIKEEYNVIALPGACAFLPALNMSNLDQDKFLFYGFLDSKESASNAELEKLKSINFTIILYEAPHRLYKTLQKIYKILGNRQISISREITKVYEEVFRGTVLEAIQKYENVKGEIVIVIEKNTNKTNYDELFKDVLELTQLGMTSKDAIKYVSKKNNVSKNILYSMYEENKK